MIEMIRSVGEVFGNPYDRLYSRLNNAWRDLGGETGENVTITQIKRVIKAEAKLIEYRDRAQAFTRSEEHQDEIRAAKEKAQSLQDALKLHLPQDYDILISFFSKKRDYNEKVMQGTVDEGSRLGRPRELVRRRYIQSKSAVDYLEAVKNWRIKDDKNVHILFTPKTISS